MAEADALQWAWWWGFGRTPEILNGPFEDRALAIGNAMTAVLRDNSGPLEVRICEGLCPVFRDDFLSADFTIDCFLDHNEEVHDDEIDIIMAATDEQKQELSGTLAHVFSAWRRKHNFGRPRPTETRNDEVQLLCALPRAQAC